MAKCVGYTPKPWQRAVHSLLDDAKGTGRVVVCKSKRQCGKSLLAANELLRYAISYNNTTNAYVSPTINQSRKVFKDICKAIEGTGIMSKKNESLLEISLVNGSEIIFKSGQQRDGLRGITVSGILILDECAYLDEQILELVLAWTNVYRAPILMLSTPRLKSGFFYNYYTQGLDDENEKIRSVDWCEYDTSEFLDNETLELYRKMLPVGQFRTEFLGEFIDEGGGVFTFDRSLFTAKEDQCDGKLYIGIDFANGDRGDFTVVTGLDENGNQVFMKYCNNLTPLQQVDWLTRKLQEWKPRIGVVIAEKNSMGNVYIDMLKNSNPNLNIVEFVTDNTKKREIIESLAAAIGEGNIRLIDNKEAKKEFNAYQMEITKGGAITYNGAAGINDDIVMATAFALYGKKKYSGARYVLSF